MEKTSLVSIIIPCYNAASYIAETLESVIAQTYTHWECIIVDDHSTDNSWEILQDYQQRYPEKIFVYKNPRKGACAARNTGIDNAKGEYIQFLDADDILDDMKLQEQIKDANNESILSSKWGLLVNSVRTLHESYPLYQNLSPVDYFQTLYSNFGSFFPPHCFLVPSDIIKNKRIRWNEMLIQNQDGEFFCRVILNSKKVIFVENAIVYYRRDNPTSLSSRKSLKIIMSRFESYKSMLSAFNQIRAEESKKRIIRLFVSKVYCKYYQCKEINKWCNSELKKIGYLKFNAYGGKKFRLLAYLFGTEFALFVYSKLRNKN